jgi:hypothetical protein
MITRARINLGKARKTSIRPFRTTAWTRRAPRADPNPKRAPTPTARKEAARLLPREVRAPQRVLERTHRPRESVPSG